MITYEVELTNKLMHNIMYCLHKRLHSFEIINKILMGLETRVLRERGGLERWRLHP
jgi:hypothetical protein